MVFYGNSRKIADASEFLTNFHVTKENLYHEAER